MNSMTILMTFLMKLLDFNIYGLIFILDYNIWTVFISKNNLYYGLFLYSGLFLLYECNKYYFKSQVSLLLIISNIVHLG